MPREYLYSPPVCLCRAILASTIMIGHTRDKIIMFCFSILMMMNSNYVIHYYKKGPKMDFKHNFEKRSIFFSDRPLLPTVKNFTDFVDVVGLVHSSLPQSLCRKYNI